MLSKPGTAGNFIIHGLSVGKDLLYIIKKLLLKEAGHMHGANHAILQKYYSPAEINSCSPPPEAFKGRLICFG